MVFVITSLQAHQERYIQFRCLINTGLDQLFLFLTTEFLQAIIKDIKVFQHWSLIPILVFFIS